MGFLRDPELAQDICGVCRHSTPNEDGTLGTGSVRFRKIPFDAAEEEPIFSFAGKRYLLTYARPERSPEEELRDLTAKLELCAKEAANIGLLQCKNAQMALGLAHENIRGAAGFFTRIAYALIPLRKWIYLPFYERTRSSTARLEKLSRGLILKKDYSLLADGEKARVEFGDSLLSGREIAAIRATSLQIANDIGNLRRINVFDQNEPENEPIVLPSEEGGYPAFLQKLGSVDGRGRTAKFTDKLILTPTSRESLRRICQRFADPVDMDGLLQVLCGDPPGTDATKNALRQYNSRISAFASLAASCHSDLPDYLFRSGGLPKYLVEIPSEGGKVSELFTAACSSAGESAGIAGRSEALRISSQNALSHDELAALDIIVRDPTRRAGTAILNFPSYKFAQHGDSSPSACVRDFRTRSDAYLSDQKAVEVFGVIIQSNPAIRKKAQKMALKLLEQKFAEVRDNAEACGLAMEHIFALQRIMAVTLQAERQSRGSGASATGAEEEKLLHLVQALHEHISGRWVSNPSSVNDREICVFCQAARICEVTFGKKTSSNGAALLAYLATNPNCGFMELGRLSPAGAASPADMLGGCRGGEEVVSFIVAKGKNLLGEENANRDRLIADLTSALKIISLDFRYDFANGIIVDDGTGRPIGRRGVKPPIWSKLVIDEGHERVESTDSTELVRVDGCVHVNSETHETVRIDPSTGKQQTLLAVGGEMKFSFLADFVLFRDGDGCHAFHHSDLRQEVFTIQNVENEWKIFLPVPEHRELIFVPARNARMKVGHLAVFDEQNKPDMIIPLFNNRTDQQQQLRSQSIDGKSVLVEHIHGAETGLHAIPTPSFLIGNLFPYSDFGYFSEIGGKVIVAKIVGKEVFRFDRESRKLIVAPHEKTHADYIANVSLMNAIIDACRADNPVMPTEEQIEFLCEFMQSWSDRADDETVRESIIRATCGIMLLLNAKNASELSIKSRNLLVKSLQKVVARFPLSPIEMTTVHTLTETLYSLHKNKVDNEVGDTDLSFETMRHNFDIEADALYKSLWGMWQTALPDDKEAILQAAMAMASLAAACVAPNEQKQWNQRCEDIKKQKAVQNLTALEISTKKRRSSDVAPAAAPVLVKFGAVAGFHGTDLVNEEKVDGSDINMAAVGYGPLCTLVDIESLQDVIDAEAPSTESEAGTVAAAEAATDLKTALQQYRERERASKVLHADLFQGRMTELAANFELMEARLLTAKQSLAAQVGDVHEICDALDRKITEFMLDLPDETVKQKRILGQLDNPTRDAVLWLWFHSLERGEDGKFAINRARFYDEYRRRYDDSLTNPSQVDVLITAAQNFLIAKTNCDAADARLAAFVRFETRARAHMRAGGRDLGLIQEAFGEFVQTLAAARTFDPNENLFTLWFEYAAGMRLLPGKKAILDGIEKRFAGERTNYTDTEIGVIIQLMMGGGKTSVVISQAIALLSGKGRVALVVNDASQHNTMCNTLKILQEERFDQGFREIPYDINEVRKIAALRDLRDTIYSARQNGSGVAAMSVTIRAVLVQLWQSIAHTQRLERRISELERTMPPNKGELQKLRAQLKAYEERLSLCREIVTGIHGFCIQIGDECHLNWDPLISVNVSEGTKQKFTTAQGKGICEFFATYDNWTTNSSIGKEAVLRIQSGQRPLRRHMENFAEAQLRRLGMWAQESSSRADFQNKARVAFLLGKCDGLEDDGSTRTGFQLDRKTVLEQFSNDEAAREQFLLCVAQMQTFYATSLKKFMEDFGLCRKNGKVTVSPYRAANTPSPGQFANPLENANATFLTYLRLRKADAPAHHLSLFHEQVSRSVADVSAGRAPKVRAFLETKYERLMGRIFDSNGSTTDRKAAENELVAALAATRDGSLVDYLELVFAMNADDQLSFPSSRWECTSFSQTALSPCIGSTGTPFNVSNQGQQFSGHQSIDETTPLCIASKAEKDLREGKSVLFELRSRDPESLAPVSVADLFTAQQNAANKKPQKVRALMDAAGLFKHLSNEDVARQMLEQCDPQVQRCVFYHDGFWIAVGRDGSRIRLSDTSEKAVRKDAGLSREEIAVFYDQAHCTGTDFKIALDAHGTVTVHRQTPISDLNQAILRERQFLSTQRVDVCAVDMDIFADKGSLASANEMADRYIALVQSAGENEEKKVGEKKFECYKKEARSAMLRIVQEKYFELSAQRDQLVRKGPAMRTLYRRRIIRLGEEIRQTAT
ncbi:MAG: hypothetical protein LBH53_01835, partial [Puniceicoccales bacterium]|nr:hypothetical protein [Puniceicoccales bacterium]